MKIAGLTTFSPQPRRTQSFAGDRFVTSRRRRIVAPEGVEETPTTIYFRASVHGYAGDRVQVGWGFLTSRPNDPGLIPRPFKTSEPIPDAESVANNPDLKGVELNRAINKTYLPLANQLQKALDPQFNNGSRVAPSWYAMAIYASRGAGRGMLAAERALAIVRDQAEPMKAVREAFSQIPADEWLKLAQADSATAFLTAYSLALQDRPQRLNLDPRALMISAARLSRLLLQPGVNLETVVGTLKNTLEDGNRRIFQDIGVSGQRFLELRRDHAGLSPEQVLAHFSDQPEKAHQAYEDGLKAAAAPGPLPCEFNYGFESRHLLAAGMALYQRASQESEPELRDRLIAQAGNLLAYHEQVCVAVPAFLPGEVKPGETDRAQVMEILTPFVDVKTHHWTWEYHRFQQSDLDGSPLTPPCTEHNWAVFQDRWPPILDYFGRCYERPATLWPMPNPDPAQGLSQTGGCLSRLLYQEL